VSCLQFSETHAFAVRAEFYDEKQSIRSPFLRERRMLRRFVRHELML
jgi:hypothetical protein